MTTRNLFRRWRPLLASFAFVFWLNCAAASSQPPRPLKRLAHPSSLALDIVARSPSPPTSLHSRSIPFDSPVLHHSDSFRLTISAFSETYHLHLRPNDHLIHPAARVNYYRNSPDGGPAILDRTEPLLREAIKVYWGEVVHPDGTSQRMREDAAGGVHRAPGDAPHVLGWARIMVHDQGDSDSGTEPVFEGAFTVNGVAHHVVTKENYLRNKHELDPEVGASTDDPLGHLVIFRDSDLISEEDAEVAPMTCAHDSLEYNVDEDNHPVLRWGAGLDHPIDSLPWYDSLGVLSEPHTSRVKRGDINNAGGMNMSSNFIGSIGSNAGCPKTQKIVYVGVAADCEYVQKYGTTAGATTQILNNFNSASSLYKTTFNVSLGVVELNVQDPVCPTSPPSNAPWNVPCSNSTDLNTRLSLISAWRGQKGPSDGAGLWHLMSGCPTGSEVGVAWLGQLCNVQSSGVSPQVVSGTAVTTASRSEWQVVAHETGHNFGAIHDCTSGCSLTDGCCPLTSSTCDAAAAFVMSPVSEPGEITFSACTVGNICSVLQSTLNTTCLQDPDSGTRVISLQMCGNGIVEAGEDCDPGVGNTSPCCDSTTCKFTAGAVCDPKSSDCCSGSCQFAPSTQVCRPAKDAKCDIAEMCTGNNSTCPADKTVADGTSCGSNGLACASGLCTSINLQCQTVGASMGLQKACPSKNDQSCLVSCQDPTKANFCVQTQTSLVDGSPCGYGGTCKSNKCISGSWWDTFKAWFVDNKQISIPVTVIVGVIVVLVLWGILSAIRRCCCGRRDKGVIAAPPMQNVGHQRLNSWAPYPGPNGPLPPVAEDGTVRPETSPLMYSGPPGPFGSDMSHHTGFTDPRPRTISRESEDWGNRWSSQHALVPNGVAPANSLYPGPPPGYSFPPTPTTPTRGEWVNGNHYNGR
ncbi:hypothetical protein BOTBODRAFT_29847 [Botryobasidium botryosum FD-172 SS1]|uniref:Disintegrin and metalloproteinase domain-containing protein B n=1 Tax=Botryobasidium botryosum (strain FD-172 SS1) TaxID=930990 RepID=A0A067MQ35_BOTB1|nr:hypothetical protein BOTBODRAFT_29847 [Botryobasidium botryosum FD-172 SS1]